MQLEHMRTLADRELDLLLGSTLENAISLAQGCLEILRAIDPNPELQVDALQFYPVNTSRFAMYETLCLEGETILCRLNAVSSESELKTECEHYCEAVRSGKLPSIASRKLTAILGFLISLKSLENAAVGQGDFQSQQPCIFGPRASC